MDESEFDILVITHLPSFYKVNLYNELCRIKKIHVIFIGNSSAGRVGDFVSKGFSFPHTFLNTASFEERRLVPSAFALLRMLRSMRYKNIIVNGWDLPEFWLSVIAGRGSKGVAVESTIFESKVSGIKKLVKKAFLFFTDFALPSGAPHQQLLESIGYDKPMKTVGGVGLSNFKVQPRSTLPDQVRKFLFVGRLVYEKNVDMLVEVFNRLPHLSLTIVGTGLLENQLRSTAAANISFLGHVDNSKLDTIYLDHDVFILPSVAEPWGLVVEEAIQNGLPVIVSDVVGCSIDLVEAVKAGFIFKSRSAVSLQQAIGEISNRQTYSALAENIGRMDFDAYYRHQVNTYSLDWLGKLGTNE